MSEPVDPIVLRRELRRKKILENAEKRKQKILNVNFSSSIKDEVNGTLQKKEETDEANAVTISNNTFQANLTNVPIDVDIKKSENSEEEIFGDSSMYSESAIDGAAKESIDVDNIKMSENFDGNSLREIIRVPDPEDELIDFSQSIPDLSNKLLLGNQGFLHNQGNFSFNQNSTLISGQPKIVMTDQYTLPSTWIFKSPFFYALIAFIVCFAITMGYSNLVSDSLILLFFLVKIVEFSTFIFDDTASQPSIFSSILILCGLNRTLVMKYVGLANFLKKMFEDFAFYIFIVILWQIFIGFPDLASDETLIVSADQ